ncbi:rod shape-determining protein MreD [Spirulina sp. CS-785/01]|uniref:rod shape-determining protein MreD n=1 Tax=Spirulina sp. CS-785/01 TaxID=3021716 RepID=UPI00232ED164|nr:rod shape-determining protein MreD [Spirulina sp. CS-785/01]MDB9313528.1 rod shape-determining protein MreD [Spirulina sp. CS-785/01]
MLKFLEAAPRLRHLFNWLIIVGSALLCLLILPARLPGTELMGIRPNWLLIWVVVWSVKRTVWQGALAGIALGLIQDGMTAINVPTVPDQTIFTLSDETKVVVDIALSYPSHIISLTIVGVLTARIQKQRYIQEDFISIALIVFGMAVIAETVTAVQYSLQGFRNPALVWTEHQRIALSSAILSSLWAPVVYYPLNRWWEYLNSKEQTS